MLKASDGKAEIHSTTVYKVFARWSDDGSLEHAFIASVAHLSDQHQLDRRVLPGDGTNTVAKKGGDGIGYSGYKHQKGEKVIAIIDNNGYVLAPLPVAPVNEADTVLLPAGLKTLTRVAKLTGLGLTGAYLHLEGGVDSKSNKAIFNAGMSRTSRRILAIARVPSAGASGCSMPRFMRDGIESSGRLPGSTNSSGCCSGSSTSSSATTG